MPKNGRIWDSKRRWIRQPKYPLFSGFFPRLGDSISALSTDLPEEPQDENENGENGQTGLGSDGGTTLVEMPIEDELKGSYLTYAMSVIISRALPDVRDGLKPSQRRILVAMNDLRRYQR